MNRNEAVTCSSLPSFSLINWNKNRNIDRLRKEQIIKEAIRRAEDDLDRRRQTEFLLWSQSQYTPTNSHSSQKIILHIWVYIIHSIIAVHAFLV